jgi:uncharacterized membrane protein
MRTLLDFGATKKSLSVKYEILNERLVFSCKNFLTPPTPANQAPAIKAEFVYPIFLAFLKSFRLKLDKNLSANLLALCICKIGLFKNVLIPTPAILLMLFHVLVLPLSVCVPCIN